MNAPICMTDKASTKILPCSWPDCDKQLIVNKFESKDRARCPEHRQGSSKQFFEAATGASVQAQLPPNDALHNLACPFHPQAALKIIKLEETDRGFRKLGFACSTEGRFTYVEIVPRFSQAVIPVVSKDWKDLIVMFNDKRGHTQPRFHTAGERRPIGVPVKTGPVETTTAPKRKVKRKGGGR